MTISRLSQNGLKLLQGFEGLSLSAYRDPPVEDPSEQLWSIGYGHQLGKGPGWAGHTISREQAEQYLKSDVASRESSIALLAPTDDQGRFDALVSLAYNIGVGAFTDSTVRRLHNAGDVQGAADAFRMWRKSAGQVNPVLVARREKEREVYLQGYPTWGVEPATPAPAPTAGNAPATDRGGGEGTMMIAGLGLVFFCPGCGVRSSRVAVERGGG